MVWSIFTTMRFSQRRDTPGARAGTTYTLAKS
jgi:hypothetical protein